MSGYMLDSNVLVDIAREPEGAAAAAFGAKEISEMGISLIVSGEVRHGMEKHPQARSNPRMAYLLSSLRIDGMEPDVAGIYARVRLGVERLGKGMSANDYWIVAHAMAREAVLVTGDRAIHEAAVEGLKLEDWRGGPAVRGRD